ncbi:hypothetical protein KC726_05250 [Candidatus Woesebacteria bacterium]|nr:hypothetical protein [Candidatus Woesebacteria bacterium]
MIVKQSKKGIIFTLLFTVLFCVNIAIVTHVYAVQKQNTRIMVILDELDQLNNFTFTDEELAEYEQEGIKDKRIAVLKAFFRRYDSPLYDYATLIVQESDKNDLDHRLIPAIAMKESTACKFIPKNSYNCWGWGIYGNQITRFRSYEEAIETIAAGLKKHYVDKGYVTPEQIMMKYNPNSDGSWAQGVNHVLGVLE